MGNVKRVGDILSSGDFLSSLFNGQIDPKALEKGRISAELFTTWERIVAEAKILAAGDHSRIRELEHGILVIEAEHPGWVQLLQTKQAQLLRLVQRKFPELGIQGISFCLSRESISRPSVNPAPEYTRLPEKETMQGEQALPEKDQAIYESMKSFKKTIQKRNRNKGGLGSHGG
jgi:hypothetical protein